ncbi:hypothetical protein V8F06_005928 [Rhypophila decipiens]
MLAERPTGKIPGSVYAGLESAQINTFHKIVSKPGARALYSPLGICYEEYMARYFNSAPASSNVDIKSTTAISDGDIKSTSASSDAHVVSMKGSIHFIVPHERNTIPTASSTDSNSTLQTDPEYAESLFSVVATEMSLSSTSSTDYVIAARHQVVQLLLADKEIEELVITALNDSKIGPRRLARNFRRLLVQLSKDLLQEAISAAHKHPVKLIRTQSMHIANTVNSSVDRSSSTRGMTGSLSRFEGMGEVSRNNERESASEPSDEEQNLEDGEKRLEISDLDEIKASYVQVLHSRFSKDGFASL